MASATTIHVHPHRQPQPRAVGRSSLDLLAYRLMGRPLAFGLVLLALAQLAQWAPHYLTWPLFPDHDVFATAAQCWDAGERPYRDFRTNNFPGAIYAFWVLGKVFGWGQARAVYALDVAFLLAFGAAVLFWSRRVFVDSRPGLVAYLAWLSFYLDLDYSLTAQRDWHAGGLAVMALCALQAWPHAWGRLASACLLALAASVRPQVALFLPAWWWALGEWEGRSVWARAIRPRIVWTLVLGGCFVMAMSPLILQGLLDDFLATLRLVAIGGEYSRTSFKTIRDELLREALWFRHAAVALPLVLMARVETGPERRVIVTWLLAFAGLLLYKPLSPVPHAYLIQPLTLVWAVAMGLLAWVILRWRPAAPVLQVTALALLLGVQITGRPRFCNLERTLEAPATIARGGEPEREPIGCEFSPWFHRGASYKWRDYHDLLAYLRANTTTTTRVANVLRGYPAITSAIGRPPAFPAESIAWCLLIRPADEALFAQALEAQTDSVVVWSPKEVGTRSRFDLLVLAPTIERLYRPKARFGPFEVWERRAGPVAAEVAFSTPD